MSTTGTLLSYAQLAKTGRHGNRNYLLILVEGKLGLTMGELTALTVAEASRRLCLLEAAGGGLLATVRKWAVMKHLSDESLLFESQKDGALGREAVWRLCHKVTGGGIKVLKAIAKALASAVVSKGAVAAIAQKAEAKPVAQVKPVQAVPKVEPGPAASADDRIREAMRKMRKKLFGL